MEIKILGTGCPRCEELEKRTVNALAELGIARLTKIVLPRLGIDYFIPLTYSIYRYRNGI